MGVLLVGLLLLMVDYWAYPYGRPPGGRSFNTGENGLWLRYTWYAGKRSDADVHLLAQHLNEHQVRYAYFHVRSITRTGKLSVHYPTSARRLVASLHRDAPNVKVLAWIYAGNPRGEGAVDLANRSVRANMVQEAQWLVHSGGFDGVQWDYESCADGDTDFLALLRETRAALPKDTVLSVAAPMWLPEVLRRWGWSDGYFAQVAKNCDQLAVMCYDSGFVLPRSYVWLVRQQPIHVTQAVAQGNRNCHVLLGIPTYGKGLPSHNPRAENIRLALCGVREGLSDSRADLAAFAGVAPFADYTTGPEDWESYRLLWLTR